MKEVYVIRHADKNNETGKLTDEGRNRAQELKSRLPHFDIVLGSGRDRVTETARLLTGGDPQIDKRAGFVYSSSGQNEKLSKLAKDHPLSHAGVMYENPEFKTLATTLGDNLLELIRETLARLPENGRAMIVSQDGVMVAAEHKLHNKLYGNLQESFRPLEGFILDDNLHYYALDL